MFFTSIGKSFKGAFLSLTRQILFLLPPLIVLPLFWGTDLLSAVAAIIMIIVELRIMKREEADFKG